MNFVQGDTPSMLSLYRFQDKNAIRFTKSLDLRIDWSNEWVGNEDFQAKISGLHSQGYGWVDYATTYYWYQDVVGYDHGQLMPLDERTKMILHPNSA